MLFLNSNRQCCYRSLRLELITCAKETFNCQTWYLSSARLIVTRSEESAAKLVSEVAQVCPRYCGSLFSSVPSEDGIFRLQKKQLE